MSKMWLEFKKLLIKQNVLCEKFPEKDPAIGGFVVFT